MEIREIIQNDLNICAEIFSRTFSSEPWNEKWSTTSALERLEHFYLSKGFYGIVAEEDTVVGFVVGNSEPYYTGSIFYLREMCTDIDYQCKGVGKQLLLCLEDNLKSKLIHDIYLLTERNLPAAHFYQNRGFKIDENTGSYSKRINS